MPERLIAQQPAQRRDESRLLVVDRATHSLAHRHFRDLLEYLKPGDTLFRNNAAVIPARLHATRPTGGQVECLLLRPAVAGPGSQPSALTSQLSDEWWCLLRPGKKLPVGANFGLTGLFTATVREKTDDGPCRVAFEVREGDILTVANRIGEMPLPPYIADRENDPARAVDRERYQTVYADRGHQVAAAAPTAGLHFTPELLAQIARAGRPLRRCHAACGPGHLKPITVERIEDHAIHREVYEMPVSTQQALFAPAGRRIAVGTTSVRSIEDFLSTHSATTGACRRASHTCPKRPSSSTRRAPSAGSTP